tara:strand:- start:1210 stop:1413 length:204 start_codon:yes stop_codon:yes gene_type:complete
MKNLLAKFKFGEANLRFDFRATKLRNNFEVISIVHPQVGIFYHHFFWAFLDRHGTYKKSAMALNAHK